MSADGPRDRTIGRMRRLMALGATIGIAATTTRSRSEASPAAVPHPPDAASDGAAGELGDADRNADASVWSPEDRYGVVDPLPPPPRARGCGCGAPGRED